MQEKAFAIIGLGRMGGNLSLQALEKGWRVVGYSQEVSKPELLQAGLVVASALDQLKSLLRKRRVVLLYIPAGRAIDGVLNGLVKVLEPGDVVIDGGNSYWKDSIERQKRLKGEGLHFVDLGTSGGIEGARNGACFMAGGELEPVQYVVDLFKSLAAPGGFVHAGPPGSGHFTKLVHNGIEFGMMQAIGEGVSLLEEWPMHRLPVHDILRCWTHGSVIRSWLIELLAKGYEEQGGLGKIPPFIEDTGEVNWLVSDALRMEVPIPVIAQAVMQLFLSRDGSKEWSKAISVMRHGFGGHPFGPSEAIARERKTGRL